MSETDVIVYGNDLADFFAVEFGVDRHEASGFEPNHIRFWTDLVLETSQCHPPNNR